MCTVLLPPGVNPIEVNTHTHTHTHTNTHTHTHTHIYIYIYIYIHTNGIIFGVVLGPLKHLQVFEYPVTLQPVNKRHNIKAVTYFWQQISYPNETRFNQIRCEKSTENTTSSSALPGGGRVGTQERRELWFNFKFEMFYSGSKVKATH